MYQPDLGMKVAELRQLKGMTQEELAERCEVSTRTIQRIEGGEVDPRAYTIRCLGRELEFDFEGRAASNESPWLVALHLSSILCLVIVPLLIWSWKKSQSQRIEDQARKALNFQITMALVLFTGMMVLLFIPAALVFLGHGAGFGQTLGPRFVFASMIAPMAMVLVGLFCTYQAVINAVRALADRPVHYPLSIPFVKAADRHQGR
jgi:uncharacterized Tic20 family protein/DNA-binding XRE family transcriptional regulator